MGKNNEANGEMFFFEFTGAKTKESNKSWSDEHWGGQLSHLRTLPLKDDVIDFKRLLKEDSLLLMTQDFETTQFIVFKRELFLEEEPNLPHCWNIYIKPYFPDEN